MLLAERSEASHVMKIEICDIYIDIYIRATPPPGTKSSRC